ncbi:putative ribonuclease H-like domain-containing protein [Tanacetum coccineum]
MKDKFQMSSMGELTLFLGLQVQQKEDGIFISQDKYVAEILKKFNYSDVKSASTLVDLEKPLVKDGDVDVHLYRSMIGSLMYLTASRPDIMFAVCACARFQVTPKTSHLLAVKRIFRYLKGKPTLGLWLISWQYKKQTMVATSTTKAEYVAAASCCGQNQKHLGMSKEVGTPRYLNLVVPLKKVGDEAVHKELGDRMEMAATTAFSLEAEQDSGSGPRCQDTILRDVGTQTSIIMSSPKFAETHNVVAFLKKPVESDGFAEIIDFLKSSFCSLCLFEGRLLIYTVKVGDEAVHKELGDRVERVATTASSLDAEQDSDSGPRCQDTILGDVDAQTRFGITSKQSNDLPLSIGYTLGSGEDSMKLLELMELFNAVRHILMLSVQVPAVEGGTDCLPTTTIFEELARMGYEKPSQKLTFYKAFFSPQWKYFIHTITQCLSAKSTAWNEFSSTMASLIICLATNQKFNLSKYIFDAMVKHLDGGVKFLMYPRFLQVFINQQLGDMSHHKKIFVNPSHTKKVFANMKRAGKDFSGRITPLFDTMMVQASEEQKQKSKRRQRKEIEVPQDETEHEESVPTPSNDPQPSGEDSMQLNDLMVLCTKLHEQDLDLVKAKDAQAKEIAALKKRVQRLERKKVVRKKLKAAERRCLEGKEQGKEQQQESLKKQRMEEDKETDEVEEVEEDDEAELKKNLVIKKDDDIAIDVIPLATKPPVIVDYKLLKEGIMVHYQLIRAYGSSKRHSSMIRLLQGINREDLQTLWKLVKTKHGDLRAEDEHERVLWGDLKVMFEPDIRSDVWRNLQGYKVTIWKLIDSCGVHFVKFENVHIFMLVEKRYPLTPITITNMLNKKLQADHWNKMCYQLLKLMIQKMNIKFKGGLLGLKRLQGFLEVTTAQLSRTTGLRRLKKVGMSRRFESSKDQESLGDHEDASKQGRSIEDIDADAEVTLVNETQERQDDDLMFDTRVLDDDEVFVDVTTVEKEKQSTKTGEATLMEIKAAKPKAKGIVLHDQEEQVFVFKPTVSVTQPSVKDKGKGIKQEPERPLTKKDQVAIDEDLARNIQAQLDAEIIEEERIERQKQEEANIALIESWGNTQAMMEADRLLAERLQTREREELTDEEKGKLFMELMKKRRKHFADLRAQEKRNGPPTKAHKRTQMSTYLKHMVPLLENRVKRIVVKGYEDGVHAVDLKAKYTGNES